MPFQLFLVLKIDDGDGENGGEDGEGGGERGGEDGGEDDDCGGEGGECGGEYGVGSDNHISTGYSCCDAHFKRTIAGYLM